MYPKKGILAYWERPEDGGSSEPAPGTGEESTATIDPSAAEPITPESGSTPPQTIPYSRFKEVNDARRASEEALAPFRELEAAGYTAEDFQRLVAWETEFASDPVATMKTLVGAVTEGVTDEAKQTILDTLESLSAKGAETDPVTSSEEKPKDGSASEGSWWDQAPDEVKEIFQDYRARKAEELQQQVSGAFDALLDAWDELDKAEKITTPKGSKYAWIAAASTGGATDPLEILASARAGYLADREELAGDIVGGIRNGDKGPRSVPGGGSGSATRTAPEKPKSLREATKMAEAAAARGTLVMTEE